MMDGWIEPDSTARVDGTLFFSGLSLWPLTTTHTLRPSKILLPCAWRSAGPMEQVEFEIPMVYLLDNSVYNLPRR
jgi:hypothetical protein